MKTDDSHECALCGGVGALNRSLRAHVETLTRERDEVNAQLRARIEELTLQHDAALSREDHLRQTLWSIARYGEGRHGICPYGCDTPHIAETALNESEESTVSKLRAQVETLKGEIEGTEPFSANPAKWGLRAMCQGFKEQADALREDVATLTKERDEARAEVDALRALSKLPEYYCLSCGGTGGHEEGCRGTTGLLALRAQLAASEADRERIISAWREIEPEVMSRIVGRRADIINTMNAAIDAARKEEAK